jgi:hypothetical protein
MNGLTPTAPTLESHDEIVAHQDRRVKRAAQKLDNAQEEVGAAAAGLTQARAGREAFIAENPDEQGEMF